MGRREGTIDPRVCVAVSLEMADLRRTQTALNQFLWSTELSLNYILDHFPKSFTDLDQPAAEALIHLNSTAWYKNNQGRLKYSGSIGDVVTQIAENPPYLYRAVLTYFASAFEDYLDRRLGKLKKNKNRSWGPYYKSLSLKKLINSSTPLQLKDVISADLCRFIRNRVVHPPFNLPTSKTDPELIRFRDNIISKLKSTPWWNNSAENIIKNTVGQFIGEIVNHKKRAPEQPIELFYALFNFTCLDTLAFQIEEALVPENQHLEGYAWRKKDVVRRRDLIFEPTVLHNK